MRQQKELIKMVEKQRVDIANQLAKDYFPYTHGDNIERERELIKSEQRHEFLLKQEVA